MCPTRRGARWARALTLTAIVALAAAPSAAAVGEQTVTAPGGEQITVGYSPTYTPDQRPSAQSYADFLGGLVHGSELNGTRIYVAHQDEVTAMCSRDQQAGACYTQDGVIVVPGSRRQNEPDPPRRSFVTHEYGHRIAEHRETPDDFDNLPAEWGPRRWSSYEHVCQGAADGTLFPGNEADHYHENPGESWAETYVRLNDPSHVWGAYALEPDQGALDAARRDVLEPFTENTKTKLKASFGRRGTSKKNLAVPIDLDGYVNVEAKSAKGLEVDVIVSVDGAVVDRSPYKGRLDRANGFACRQVGGGKLTITVKRRKGSGKVALTLHRPMA